MLKQAHIYIKGDVIGIGFRAWAKIQAKIVGVTGWIRNVYDHPDKYGMGGGIEALIQGPEDKVTRFVELLQVGPSIAHVRECEVFLEDTKEIFETFEIKK